MPLLIPKENNINVDSVNDLDSFDSFCLNSFEYSENKDYFVLANKDDPNEVIRIEYPFPTKNTPSPYSVSVYTFRNQYIKQNNIFELKILSSKKNKRIGYAFMLSALLDKDNAPFDKHSLPFAYYCYEKLIEGITKVKPKIPRNKNDEYVLSDFYDEDLALIVVCHEQVKDIPNYIFDNYLFDLYSYGFIYIEDQNKKCNFNNLNIIREKFDSLNSGKIPYTLHIKRASNICEEETYTFILIKKIISDNAHCLTKFHVLYQIIELLIDIILRNEIKQSIIGFDEKMASHKLKDKITTIASESARIRKLFNEYSKISDDYSDLYIDELKEFFKQVNVNLEEQPSNDKLANLLYKFRNNLVHNFRLVYNGGSNYSSIENLIIKLNEYFEYLIIEILLSFELRK